MSFDITVKVPEIPYAGGHDQDHYWGRAAWNIRKGFDVGGSNVSAAIANVLDQIAEGIRTPVAQQWRVFDKDDESTWPKYELGGAGHYTEVWVFAKGRLAIWGWRDRDNYFWGSPDHAVTHWMPIERPSPPSSSETGSKKQ